MKKLSLYIFLGLLVCNVGFALTPCKGDDYKKWRNCSGTFTNEDGHVYTGSFDRKGNRFGKSKVMYNDGESYVGYYKNDLKHGNGTYTFAHGGSYTGQWKNNESHGWGTETGYTEDGEFIIIGEFRNDRPYKVKIKYSDGDIFTGTVCLKDFPANQFTRVNYHKGVLKQSNGHTRKGTWDCETREFTAK